jgi:hypothetical protein
VPDASAARRESVRVGGTPAVAGRLGLLSPRLDCRECLWLETVAPRTAGESAAPPRLHVNQPRAGVVERPDADRPAARPGWALLEQGRLREAREEFWCEAGAAERRGDPEDVAVAALGLGGMWVHEHRSTLERSRVVAVQRRALQGLDPQSPLAHRLRVRLAAEHAYASGHGAPMLAAADDARERHDPIVLAEALSLLLHCLIGPHFELDRTAVADELIETAESTGRPLDALMGLMWRTVGFFLTGDRRSARALRELREHLGVTPCDALEYLVAAIDVMLEIRAGRLDDAERAAQACYELGLTVGDADAFGWYGAQIISIRWLQGRGDELLPLLRELAQSPTVPEQNDAFIAATAAFAAAAGDHQSARSALASVRIGGLRTIPPSSIWMATLLGVCEAAHLLGDKRAAKEAYELLAPFAHLPVMVSLAVACYGSAHRPLGLAAWTLGDLDRAVGHLESAVAADLAIGNAAVHALDSATLADALECRDGPGDRERTIMLRDAAIDAGHRFGMHARVQQWRSRATGDARRHQVACDLDGRVWRVRLDDRVAVIADSRGMRQLAQLIDNPGKAIPAIELASGFAMTDRDSCQPMLDPTARRAYRERVAALEEDIDDADRCADLERAARSRAELDRLIEELAAATGLAGRSRSFGREAERARVSVQKAIRRALSRITEADPGLGEELSVRVVTGANCVFLDSE